MGNHEHAIADFERAIELDPYEAVSYLHKGVSKLKSHMTHEAIIDFNKSEDLEQNPAVYDGLGCCYHAQAKYDEAINFFNQAIEKKPNNVQFLKNRSQCYYDMKQFDLAIKDLDTAREQNAYDPQVLYKQGIAYFAYQKYKKCIKTMKAAL